MFVGTIKFTFNKVLLHNTTYMYLSLFLLDCSCTPCPSLFPLLPPDRRSSRAETVFTLESPTAQRKNSTMKRRHSYSALDEVEGTETTV